MHSATLPFEEVRMHLHATSTQPFRLKRFGYDRRKLIREGSVCGVDMRFRTHGFARNATFARRGSDATAGSSFERGRSVG